MNIEDIEIGSIYSAKSTSRPGRLRRKAVNIIRGDRVNLPDSLVYDLIDSHGTVIRRSEMRLIDFANWAQKRDD